MKSKWLQTLILAIILIPMTFICVILSSVFQIIYYCINRYAEYSFTKQINNHWRYK